NFMPAPSRNGFRILKFTSKLSDGSEILKFMRALARLADIAQNFVSRNGFNVCEPLRALHRVLPNADKAEAGRGCGIAEKLCAVKFNHAGGYLNSARRYIARFCSAAVRRGYEVGREEKFSKFDLTGALLNFISLLSRKFKLALLKFMREVPRNRFEILKFTPKLSNRFEILKFMLALHKFKPASIPFLNFISNFTPHASASKFENGVKFKDAAKFKRGVR
ncbi:hypothetical protein, partial [uncultured Campylobacter sp.]|uniref:hypothetical protein n=1 Tax=uncultured Campylobacter sp. TaxID=218934 RepID=UPI00260CA232